MAPELVKATEPPMSSDAKLDLRAADAFTFGQCLLELTLFQITESVLPASFDDEMRRALVTPISGHSIFCTFAGVMMTIAACQVPLCSLFLQADEGLVESSVP